MNPRPRLVPGKSKTVEPLFEEDYYLGIRSEGGWGFRVQADALATIKLRMKKKFNDDNSSGRIILQSLSLPL